MTKMEDVLPSYASATARDAWVIIALYIPSSDLCAASLVCRRWHELFMPFLWGDPASHFGTENDAVYVALTLFRRTLRYARLEVRMLTHTLHLPPALSEIYDGPRPEWLREVLDYLPCLQSLIVSKLPFFDHNAMTALREPADRERPKGAVARTYNVHLLLAENEPNTTSQGLAETLMRFPALVYLDLSYTTPARDRRVLSVLSTLEHLQVLKFRGIGLRDKDVEFLANAVGTRVRFLDLRSNHLTDMALRSLLQASFLSIEDEPNEWEATRQSWGYSSFISETAPYVSGLELLKRPDLDEKLVELLTHPLTNRYWDGSLPHAGITHLYVADNPITVEGVASLLASAKLHALDVGTVNTAESLARVVQSKSNSENSHVESSGFPGAEKLIPLIGYYAKDRLRYLRAHHAVVTADPPVKDTLLSTLLPELPGEQENTGVETTVAELDSTNEVHELSSVLVPRYELAGSPIGSPLHTNRREDPRQYDDEPLPTRRGSFFAPEVIEPDPSGEGTSRSRLSAECLLSPCSPRLSSTFPETVSPCSPSVPVGDPRSQKIQELLAKRPRNQKHPLRDGKDSSFPYLHPSYVPHLETLTLTDVPSHVPADSQILSFLIRFITACSNEALLATLQAGSDYSLPPGQARLRAEQEQSRKLFALRRLVLEIVPVSCTRRPAKLTPWNSLSYQYGTFKSPLADRDSENLWLAAMNDFSFFDDVECGIPDDGPGKHHFPMTVLNEKVSLTPEDDSKRSGTETPELEASFPSASSSAAGRRHGCRGLSTSSNAANMTTNDTEWTYQVPQVDLVAELASFRRAKKAEYQGLVREHSKKMRRSTNATITSTKSDITSPSSAPTAPIPPPPSPSPVLTSIPLLSMENHVEGHWKGEVNIVRNPAPKGRSGMSQTRHLFARAIQEVASGVSPTDSSALETLTVFLASVLKKKYTNPSSDVITVLAGLDEVDRVATDFVAVLDNIIRNGSSYDIRRKAIRTAIAIISGAYKTSLVSYFTHRDLFPSIIKFINESDTQLEVFEPFLLLGLLANYNKFEFQNPYQLRLDDFVNESTIQKIVEGVGLACAALRNGYVSVQDDIPEGWTLASTLVFFGLRALAPGVKDKSAITSPEEAREMFGDLPAPEAAILLSAYDFINANKLFGYHLVTLMPTKNSEESPFSNFLSLTSYLLQHAYRSVRVAHYAELNLFSIRILVEDPALCKLICSQEGKRKVRLCRQRQPYLPLVNGDRVLATIIFDIVIDAISHNLRRRLDVDIYSQTIAILFRLLSYLSVNKVRLSYHWSELWRTLLSLMRFMTTYSSDLTNNPHINTLTNSLVDVTAFCVFAGDTFLPDPSSYDDLFYKLVETGPIITKFRDVYSAHLHLSSTASNSTSHVSTKSSATPNPISTGNRDTSVTSIDTLLSVSSHFYSLLFHQDKNGGTTTPPAKQESAVPTAGEPISIPTIRKKNLSPKEVHRIIKQGYDTLSIQPPDDINSWGRWRETNWKIQLKRVVRCAVDDARQLVA